MKHTCLLAKRIAKSIAAVTAVASLIAAGSSLSLAQGYRLQNKPQNNPLKKIHVLGTFSVDGDLLEMLRARRQGEPNYVRIKLSSDGTWWKMIRMFDKTGREHRIEQENGGFVGNIDLIEIDTANLGATLTVQFWKAKLLGVHTHMHTQTFNKADFAGYGVTLNWREGASKSDPAALRAPINESLMIEGKKATIVSYNNGTKGYVTIVFSTSLDWWTAIKVFDRSGRETLVEKVDGSYKPSAPIIKMPTNSFPSEIAIEFWTAKLFGVHTYMATKKITRERFDGRITYVNW